MDGLLATELMMPTGNCTMVFLFVVLSPSLFLLFLDDCPLDFLQRRVTRLLIAIFVPVQAFFSTKLVKNASC